MDTEIQMAEGWLTQHYDHAVAVGNHDKVEVIRTLRGLMARLRELELGAQTRRPESASLS